MTTIIDTASDTYMVEFQNKSNGGLICTYTNLAEALKPIKEGRILKDIYRFNNSKKKFERVPKNKYNMFFGWNTEAIQILEKFNLVK